VRLRPALALLALCLAVGLSHGVAVHFAFLAEGEPLPPSRPYLWELSSALAIFLALPVVQTAVLNAPSPRAVGLARFLALHGAGFLLFSGLHVTAMLLVRHGAYALLGWGGYDYGPLSLRVPMEMFKDVTAYAAVGATWSLLLAWRERQAKALRAAQLEGELKAAQLQALTGQLDPHFLFNALNTVSAVMYEDLARTDRLLAGLGQLLRASLTAAGPTWTLAEERAHAEAYAGVLAARFGERLRVTWEVAPGLEGAQVPRFALQALVENAVKHNQDRPEALEVRIRARAEAAGDGPGGPCLRLEVEDTGRGFTAPSPAAGTGTGLAQLSRALALLYAGAARLTRGSGPEGGARVTLLLPRSVPS
jgi:hypothetical protein